MSSRTLPNPNQVLPDPIAEPSLKVNRAAAILGVSARCVYEAIERGEIPCNRVGRRITVPTARFLQAFGFEAAPTSPAV